MHRLYPWFGWIPNNKPAHTFIFNKIYNLFDVPNKAYTKITTFLQLTVKLLVNVFIMMTYISKFTLFKLAKFFFLSEAWSLQIKWMFLVLNICYIALLRYFWKLRQILSVEKVYSIRSLIFNIGIAHFYVQLWFIVSDFIWYNVVIVIDFSLINFQQEQNLVKWTGLKII